MRMTRVKTVLSWAFISLCFVVVCGDTCFAQAIAGQRPFSVNELMTLVSKVPESELVNQIERVKVSFQLDTQTTASFVRAGASDNLLKAITANYFSSLVIISPKQGEKVSATIKVDGQAQQQMGKHLWVFAHREGLAVWWPQGGEVLVKSDGGWVQGVFLGQPEDIGFNFELCALWLDDATDKQMKEYLARGETTGKYPGLPLPDGAPSATVTVAKIKH